MQAELFQKIKNIWRKKYKATKFSTASAETIKKLVVMGASDRHLDPWANNPDVY